VTGEGRRDLRKYTKKGALKKTHAKKKGCAKPVMMLVLVVVGALGMCLWGLL
jgi:hypothetical protein